VLLLVHVSALGHISWSAGRQFVDGSIALEPSALGVRSEMNKYEEICVAGEGAYGIVLKCKSIRSGELVAIKKFKENEDEDEEAARVIKREVDILRSLTHESIVGLREVFRENGTLHIVFEYVEKCMMDIMEAYPSGVGVEISRKLTCQLARAIEYCHRHHVIHRDIKLENLLVNPLDHSLRLCDFGSACNTSGESVLTDYVATRWYRAPELLVRFNDYGPGVDMWALGCVMAELVTGQALFTGETDLDQLFIINNALGPLTSDQSTRCLDLSGFVKFPSVGERQTLQKRLGHLATDQQLQFLTRVLVVDPAQRASAKIALSMPWLADRVASSTVGEPDHGMQPKPRTRQVLGVPGGTVADARLAIGIAAGASKINRGRPQDPELESIPSILPGSSSTQQGSHMQADDPCEESILEDISDGSIKEECDVEAESMGNLPSTEVADHGGRDNNIGIVAPSTRGASMDSAATYNEESFDSFQEDGSPSKPHGSRIRGEPKESRLQESMASMTEPSGQHSIGIVTAATRSVLHEPEATYNDELFDSFQEGSPSKTHGSAMQSKPREKVMRESMASMTECLPSGHDGCEDTILEELSEEHATPEKSPSTPMAPIEPLKLASSAPPRARGKPSALLTPSVRPVSGSGCSSASLTPMR